MKKTGILIFFVMLMAVVTTANAEIKARSFSVTPFAGGYFFEGNEDLKDTYTVGVRAGYNFTANLGLEGYLNYIPAQVEDANDADVKIYGYGVEGLYNFMPTSRIVPFVAVGIGGYRYGTPSGMPDINKLTVDYGAGLKYFLKENIALRADVRHVLPLNDRYNDLLVTFGVNFAFGGKGKEVAAVKVEETPAPKVPETVVEAPPAPKAAEVKVEALPAPPAPAPVVKQKPVIKEKVSITLNIEFDTAKAVVKKKYNDDIKKVADFMKTHPETNAVIEGHTDNVDRHNDPSRNIKLSQARADSVRKYLIEKFGIDASRVSAVGYGPAKPIASNDTEEGRKKNRRIQAVIEAVEVK
jgi:OOP family OmpA-OmpF porin